jgi:hypothetical protein
MNCNIFLYGFISCVISFFSHINADSSIAVAGLPVSDGYFMLPSQFISVPSRAGSFYSKDLPGITTQVLLGDQLRVVEADIEHELGAWAKVELLNQAWFNKGCWQPVTCFVSQDSCLKRSSTWVSNAVVVSMLAPVYAKMSLDTVQLGRLSMGVRVKAKSSKVHGWTEVTLANGISGWMDAGDVITDDVLARWEVPTKRSRVVRAAQKFLGTPYRWGAASGFDPAETNLTGVDCSGLVYLAYKSIGLNVPRNSHDQFLASAPIKFGKDLQPGDLVFTARIDTEKKTVRVFHVLMVAGPDLLIESAGEGVSSAKELTPEMKPGVRAIKAQDNQGIKVSLQELWSGQMTPAGYLIFFGTYLGDESVRNQLIKGLLVE